MSKLVLGISGLTAAILLMTGSAIASHDPSGEPFDEDFVTGAGERTCVPGFGCAFFALDAHSGPLGENPTGTARTGLRVGQWGGPVTCLTAIGNRAVIGGQNLFAERSYLFEVEDNAASGTPDRFGRFELLPDEPPPTTCPHPDDLDTGLAPIESGDLVVHDAVPLVPTTKEECKDGGWRDFPQFKNQGDCVSFVNQGGSSPAQ